MKGIPCKGDPVLLALKLEVAGWQEMGVAASRGGTPAAVAARNQILEQSE